MATNNSWNSQDPAQVSLGGTGAASFTAHAVLLGEGTSAITPIAVGATGTVLIGSTSADPAFGALGVNSGLTAHGVLLGENNSAIVATTAGANGAVLIGATGADPAFALLTSSGGTVSFTTGANTLNLEVANPIGGWTDVTGGSVSMVGNNNYTADAAGLTTATLPVTAAYGQVITVAGKGAGGWKIAQNASQLIHFGVATTTTGTGGSLASSAQYDVVTLVCSVVNTTWTVINSIGNISFV